jgi:hypothetical protein
MSGVKSKNPLFLHEFPDSRPWNERMGTD